MTATAATKLAELGELDLSAPIQTYCPTYPEKHRPITARDLISHTEWHSPLRGPNVEAESFNTRHYEHLSDALETLV